MPPRKRARNSSTSGSRSSETAVTTVELSGGWALSPELVQLWRSGRLTDTVVEVDGRSFAAHRLVLASACDYFNRHYDNEHMRDSDHPKLLEHVTAAAFEPLLAFLYEGTCTFDESLLAPVLRAANYLNVAPLERAAVVALIHRLSPSNALTAWTWGEELELPELAEAAKMTALEGFDEVEKIEEATLSQVQALVADDRLQAKSEEVVFSAVARFAEAKQPAEADLHNLLRNVRFPLMSRATVLETVRHWPPLQTVAGQKLLVELCVPTASGPQARHGGSRLMYLLGGSEGDDDSDSISKVDIYNADTNVWMTGTPLPAACLDAAAAVLGGKIYLLGEGHEDDESGNVGRSGVRTFDMQVGTWVAATCMTEARSNAAAAVLGGKVYAIGGYGNHVLSSAEVFDPQTGLWRSIARMPTPRTRAAAAVLGGRIFVVGGWDGREALDSVQVYDPATNTWEAAAPMGTKRNNVAVAALDGKIYAAGGKILWHPGAGFGSFKTMEVFDPLTDSWREVAQMHTGRDSFSLTAVRGKLYAAGGIDDIVIETENEGLFASVESYDPRLDCWTAVAPIPTARHSHAAVAM